MKNLIIALAVAAVAGTAGPSRADLTIVQKVEGLGQSMETTTRYKGGQTRLDVDPGGTSIIVDAKSGETINLQHAQKSYLRTPSTVVQAAVDSMKAQQGAGAAKTDAPQLKPTGRKDTVGGFPAEEYEYGASGARITLWLTHDIPNYAQAMQELSAAYSAGPLAAAMQTSVDMAHLPGFPVRIVNEVRPGTTLTSTVASVSVEPLADAAFSIPADYKEVKVPILTPPAASSLPSPVH